MAIQRERTPPGSAPHEEAEAPGSAPHEEAEAPSWTATDPRDDRRERQVCVRLDLERYAMLESLGLQYGVAPTTMARMLVNRGLRTEGEAWE
jgi:hypothetical protein